MLIRNLIVGMLDPLLNFERLKRFENLDTSLPCVMSTEIHYFELIEDLPLKLLVLCLFKTSQSCIMLPISNEKSQPLL